MKKIKVKRLPSGNYRAQAQVDGKRISVTRPTADECRCALEEAKADMIQPRSYTVTTAREAAENYIRDRSNAISPSTVRGYEMMLRNRFSDVIDLPFDQVNWQAAINREATRVSAKTVKNAWGLIRSAMIWYGYTPKPVRLPQIIQKEHLFYEPDEIKVFIEGIKDDKYEGIFLLGLHGLRKSEILALGPESVSDTTIRVRGAVVRGSDGMVVKETNKTSASRRDVPVIIPRLKALIPLSDGFKDIPEESLRRHLKAASVRSGLPYIGMHGLRHTFASLCYHCEISELQAMQFGGWSDLTVMKKIYTHLAKEDRKKAADKLRSFFV